MYLIRYTIKHDDYESGDRFLFGSRDYTDILPEISYEFHDYTSEYFRAAIADLEAGGRHEMANCRILCDLKVTRVEDGDYPVLARYLGGPEVDSPIRPLFPPPNTP